MDKKTNLEITSQGQAAVAALKGASITDAETITDVHKQISKFIEENHPERIVIDFEQVKFFSSQLLGMLLGIRARLKTYNGEVVISAIEPRLHKVFKITNLDRIFRFFPDKESAISAAS